MKNISPIYKERKSERSASPEGGRFSFPVCEVSALVAHLHFPVKPRDEGLRHEVCALVAHTHSLLQDDKEHGLNSYRKKID